MINIRAKLPTDKDRVAELVDAATADLRRIYRSTRSAVSESKSGEDDAPNSLVAVDGELIVGVVEYCTRPESLYIRGLAVDPQWRRLGIARRLISEVERVALRKDRLKVTLSTIKETGNPDIFSKLGFSVICESSADGFEGLDGSQVTKVDMSHVLA